MKTLLDNTIQHSSAGATSKREKLYKWFKKIKNLKPARSSKNNKE